jgi:hypothetical protein
MEDMLHPQPAPQPKPKIQQVVRAELNRGGSEAARHRKRLAARKFTGVC